ncbi:MAG: hypothetical protein ACRDJ9_25655, partial [Dehalococcoidia bacterium]
MDSNANVIDRRRVLRSGGALGLVGLIAGSGVARADDPSATLELDVAQDAGSFLFTWPRGQEEAPLPT